MREFQPLVARTSTEHRPVGPVAYDCVPIDWVDRSRCEAWRVCLLGVVVVGVAHGRLGFVWGGGWLLLGWRVFAAMMVCGGRVPMCGEGGLCTWEQDHDRY